MELYINVLVSVGLSKADGDILNEYCFNKNITNIFELIQSHIFRNGRKLQIYHLNGLSIKCKIWVRVLVGITLFHNIDKKHETAIIINAKIAGIKINLIRIYMIIF